MRNRKWRLRKLKSVLFGLLRWCWRYPGITGTISPLIFRCGKCRENHFSLSRDWTDFKPWFQDVLSTSDGIHYYKYYQNVPALSISNYITGKLKLRKYYSKISSPNTISFFFFISMKSAMTKACFVIIFMTFDSSFCPLLRRAPGNHGCLLISHYLFSQLEWIVPPSVHGETPLLTEAL